MPEAAVLDEIARLAEARRVGLIRDRRRFHVLAELGWEERRTTEEIVQRLEQLGYRVFSGPEFLKDAPRLGVATGHPVPETGCAAELDTGRAGPVVCLRVDIDGLPIEEAPPPHRPASEGWASANPNVMHACGHDGHIAIGLGVAEVLAASMRNGGAGRFRLIFQPAEEGVRGGRAVVDAGWMKDVDLLLGFHIGFGVPAATLAAGVRGFLATKKLRVRLTGRAAHAGKAPERGRNALLAACQMALGLHALAQSSAPGLRVNVGRLEAGRALNVVPDEAELLVELRAERSAELEEVSSRARRLIEGTAAASEVAPTIEVIGEAGEWRNPQDMAAWAGAVAERSGAFDRVLADHVFGASEDATLLARAVAERGGTAGYFLLGAGLAGDHHTLSFDFDEEVLARGTLLFSAMAATAMGRELWERVDLGQSSSKVPS